MVPSPPVSFVWAAYICCFLCGQGRGIADEDRRIAILLEDPSKVVNFLLKIVLHLSDPPGPIMETAHHTSLHVGRMMGLEVEIPVHVCGFL